MSFQFFNGYIRTCEPFSKNIVILNLYPIEIALNIFHNIVRANHMLISSINILLLGVWVASNYKLRENLQKGLKYPTICNTILRSNKESVLKELKNWCCKKEWKSNILLHIDIRAEVIKNNLFHITFLWL